MKHPANDFFPFSLSRMVLDQRRNAPFPFVVATICATSERNEDH